MGDPIMTDPKALIEPQKICRHCDGSGLIARSYQFPLAYRGPGPVPEDARHVYEDTCDVCGGGGRVY